MKINLENIQDLGPSTLRQIIIHAINQLTEKCSEYNIPLCVAFVDYEKAFDSVQTIARTKNRRYVHRNPERHIYGQLSDSTSAQI